MTQDSDGHAADATGSDAVEDDDAERDLADRDGDDRADVEDGDARESGGRPAVVERDAVESAFPDAAPRTLDEVVAATGLEPEATERVLDSLVDAGALATKDLALDDAPTDGDASSETESRSLQVWYRPASRHVERFASDADAPAADAVADAVAALDVPGVSEMMQDWRRDAIRGAWEYVVDAGAATDDAIVDAVYPAHAAGYDDPEAWWACVRPRLATLPGITPPEDGDTDVWTYTPN